MSKSLAAAIFLIFVASDVVQTLDACSPFAHKYTVKIESGVPADPTPLVVHCKSGNGDLGPRVLELHQSFNFTFCNNIFGTTLFFCSFQWGSKHQSFDVFNKRLKRDCTDNLCNWFPVDGGLYLSLPDTGFVKMYDWLS